MSDGSPLQRCVRKLDLRGNLSPEDRAAFLMLPGIVKEYRAKHAIIESEDQIVGACAFIASGIVSNFKIVSQSARQVVAFALPGDAVDLASIFFSRSSFHARAETDVVAFLVEHRHILRLIAERPALMRALWVDTLIDANIAREWTANIGQRRGPDRVGHLFLELDARFSACGLTENGAFEWPIRQDIFAAALGLSLVHFNKSLGALKRDGFLLDKRNNIEILRKDELAKRVGFDGYYLRMAMNNQLYDFSSVAGSSASHRREMEN